MLQLCTIGPSETAHGTKMMPKSHTILYGHPCITALDLPFVHDLDLICNSTETGSLWCWFLRSLSVEKCISFVGGFNIPHACYTVMVYNIADIKLTVQDSNIFVNFVFRPFWSCSTFCWPYRHSQLFGWRFWISWIATWKQIAAIFW